MANRGEFHYLLYWAMVPVYLLIAILCIQNHYSFEVVIHDTYFIIGGEYPSYCLILLNALLGLGNYIALAKRFRLKTNWTLIHFSLIILLPIPLIPSFVSFQRNPARYYEFTTFELPLLLVSFVILLLAQLIYFANLLHGYWKKNVSA